MSLFQGFLHPLLLWGTALAAVPLVIHILNRRRYRPVPWAAMRFVQAAFKRTRRRVQLENWLLLFLRMAAVACLAFALSRPYIGKESPLAPLTEKRRDLALILDGSASTGYRESTRSVAEILLERARTLLGELDGTRGDRVHLYYAGASPRLLSSHAPDDALSALTTVGEPLDEPLDLAAAMIEVVALAEEDAGSTGRSALEVRLLCDLQRTSFLPAAAAAPDPAAPGKESPTPPLQQALDRLADLGIVVWVEDLGPGTPVPPNVGIESVAALGEVLGAGLGSEIGVQIRNFGLNGRAGVRVALTVDGERRPSQKVDLDARSSAEVVFPLVLERPGFHALSAEIEGDRLAVDDARQSVVHVPAPLRVLLVNGAPNEDIGRDEVGFLRAALEPPDDSGTIPAPGGVYAPFLCTVVPAAALGSPDGDPSNFDVLVIANVASLSAGVVERLEDWVASGGALLLTLGDRAADPSAVESLNVRLWRADETGLAPARLLRHVAVATRYGSFFRAVSFQEDHPALSFFADERWRSYLTEIPIYEFVASEPLASTRVLASLDDEEHSPLLLERSYERGRVFLWCTSIDGDWNRFPESPATLIPLAHELLRYAGTGSLPVRNLPVGGRVEVELESFPRNAMLVRPDGSRAPVDGEPEEVVQGIWRLPPIGPLERRGLWRLEAEGAGPTFVATQLVACEGDLERLSPDELEATHRAWKVFHAESAEHAGEENPNERGELWRWFAAATLGLLVLETLWAAWIGRGRRLA